MKIKSQWERERRCQILGPSLFAPARAAKFWFMQPAWHARPTFCLTRVGHLWAHALFLAQGRARRDRCICIISSKATRIRQDPSEIDVGHAFFVYTGFASEIWRMGRANVKSQFLNTALALPGASKLVLPMALDAFNSSLFYNFCYFNINCSKINICASKV